MLQELLLRLSEGDDSVVNDIIELEVPLANKLAHRFRVQFPNKQMDITSVALVALVQGVHKLVECAIDSIEPTLNIIIRNAILDFLNDDNIIPISRRQRNRAIEKGCPIQEPRIWSLDVRTDNDGHHEISDDSYIEEIKVLELYHYFTFILTSDEKSILNQMIRGETQKEIAEGRGVSRSYINQIIKDIRKKCYAISIHSKWEDNVQRCRFLQRRQAASKAVLSTKPVCCSHTS